MPQKPTPEAKLAALFERTAIIEGHKKGVPPEVGARISIKPDKVRAIRSLAADGHHCRAIARKLNLWESGVRRYAKDYGIKLPKGDSGGPSEAQVRRIVRRRARVSQLLDEGWTQRAIAKKLGYSTFTINQDAQYVRAKKGEIV
jgi:DNA-binding NarL/FixJ family response regulator